jgi:hypothetical protein
MRGMNKYFLICPLLVLHLMVQGQKVYFNGLGRALITNDMLKGNILKGDTATPNSGVEGYVLFDLGVNMQPYDYLRAKAIFRLKNKFGIFFGQGASVEFRQVLLEGLIAKKARYALGDIDVMMTPYTVFNNPDTYTEFEADIYRIRRDIVYYENFNFGNNWRVQGAKLNANLVFKNSSAMVKLNTFISRTRPTNYYNLPDRFLAGASAQLNIGRTFDLGVNYVRFFDLQNQTGRKIFKNDVITASIKLQKNTEKILLLVTGEGGLSLYKNIISSDTGVVNNDFFGDGMTEVQLKSLGLKMFGGYKFVGSKFSSQAAQTLRVDVTRAPVIFPDVINNQVPRTQLLYDRFTQENLYNQTIMPSLMYYLPQYGNVLPYGAATPNRKGYTVGLTEGSSKKLINASARADILSEINGEGTPALRKFTLVRGGVFLYINKLLKSDRIFTLSGGIKMENTKRQGPFEVSLISDQVDGGLTAETFRNLDLLFGYKLLYAKGNEYAAKRNLLNEIQTYDSINVDFRQQVFSFGIRYRFSEKSVFTVNGNFGNNNLMNNSTNNYSISQYFICYSLSF